MTGRDREKAFAREDERARWHAAKRQREIRERELAQLREENARLATFAGEALDMKVALEEIAAIGEFDLVLDPKRPQRIARRVLRLGEFA